MKWQELIVWNDDGLDCGTLSQWIDDPEGHVDILDIDIHSNDGSLSVWPDHFVAAPGEQPDCDTPKLHVDWDGFAEALIRAQDRVR